MIMDSAGWHATKKLVLPENISILPLPPYSPELNPTEHIWDYIREQKEFNNYTFDLLDAVDNQLGIALCDLYRLAFCNIFKIKINIKLSACTNVFVLMRLYLLERILVLHNEKIAISNMCNFDWIISATC